MARQVIMPKLGLTMTEGTIEEWKVQEGDAVQKDDVLCEVSTDKLTNTINAKEDGIIRKILVEEGETVDCQTVIAIMGTEDEDISALLP